MSETDSNDNKSNDNEEQKQQEQEDDDDDGDLSVAQLMIDEEDDCKPPVISNVSDTGDTKHQRSIQQTELSTETSSGTIDDADADADADGPSLMMEDEDNHPSRNRQAAAYTKPGAIPATPLVAMTTEHRQVPAHLQINSGNSNNASLSREKACTTVGAQFPGAVAVGMAGIRHPTDRTTTTIDPERMRDIQASLDRNSLGEVEAEEEQGPPNASTLNDEATRLHPSHTLSSAAEQRLERRLQARHTIEETEQEEVIAVAEFTTGMVTAPFPSDHTQTTTSGSVDIEANVTRLDDSYHGDDPHMEGTIQAQLVVSSSSDTEEQRKKLKEQAEQAAREKFLANAAEAQIVEHDDDEKIQIKRWKSIAAILITLLVGMLIIVVVVVILRNREAPPLDRSTCEIAEGPLNISKNVISIPGEILRRDEEENDIFDVDVTCQIEHEGGFGQWYTLIGDDARLQVSTCDTPENINLDSEILVFEGECGNLSCVGASDELCGAKGSHGSVGWWAQKSVTYKVLVRGHRASSVGNFTLTVQQSDSNGNCENATHLPADGKVIGSTRGQHILGGSFEGDCAAEEVKDEDEKSSGNSTSGAWYQMKGDGNLKCAVVSTENGAFDFPVSFAIYAGECDSQPKCAGMTTSKEILWQTISGITYLLRVKGERKENTPARESFTGEGDFVLEVKDAPPNSLCKTAEELSINRTLNRSILASCQSPQQSCHQDSKDLMNERLFGLWYGISGTGNLLELSVCYLQQETESPIRIYISLFDISHGCENPQCMYTPSRECGNGKGKRLRWFSSKGSLYRILIQSSNPVDFAINVTEYQPSTGDSCGEAAPLAQFDAKYLSYGSTENANADSDIASCLPPSPGVFFKVNGTGSNMVASTCHKGTSQAANITILTGGCDSLVCLDNVEIGTCDGVHPIVSWSSLEGQEYIIHVAGDVVEGQDRFVLSAQNGTLGGPNNFCSGAIPLLLNVSEFGTNNGTAETLEDNVDLCQDHHLTGPGFWYSFMGVGAFVTASLCSNRTTFDTQLRVYAGDCTSLQCVGYNDDFCDSQSEVTWQAVQGVPYYLLVSGYKGQTGDFELLVSQT
jgi:hypothetical protein